MKKTLNFDKFIEEKEHDPIEVTVKGRKYNVDPVIPAIVPVTMARAEEEMSSAETNKLVLRAADGLFGAEAVNQMCKDGISVEDLGTLVMKVFSMINGDADEDDDEQELSDDSGKVNLGAKKAKK